MSELQYTTGIGDLKRIVWRRVREPVEKKPRETASRSLLRASLAAIVVSVLLTWVCLDAILSDVPHTVPAHHTGR